MPTLPNREAWIDNEVVKYYAYLAEHPRGAELAYESPEEARRLLAGATPHFDDEYPWVDKGGKALVGELEWTPTGPILNTVALVPLAFDEDGRLCVVTIERSDTPGIMALAGGFQDPHFLRNETKLEAALREAAEETGLQVSELPPDAPAIFQPQECGVRKLDGVTRRFSESTYSVVFFTSPPGELGIGPTREAPVVRLSPVDELLGEIAAGVKGFSDHKIICVQAISTYRERVTAAMESDPALSENEHLVELCRQIDDVGDVLRALATAPPATLLNGRPYEPALAAAVQEPIALPLVGFERTTPPSRSDVTGQSSPAIEIPDLSLPDAGEGPPGGSLAPDLG
jgi:8-oxo-dGTP pyrophosphatase MutT (NUDIX family)